MKSKPENLTRSGLSGRSILIDRGQSAGSGRGSNQNKVMKRYLPILILTGIIAVSAPYMRPVQSQPLAERLSRINSQRAPQHDVVIIQGEGAGAAYDDGNGYAYHYQGFVIVNSSSSPNAPHFPNDVINKNVALTNLADGIAMLLDQGFERQPSVDGWIFVRSR